MKYPAEIYSPSPRSYTGLSEVEYPFHDRTITVTQCGRICIGRRKINLSGVFAGQNVGITEVSEKIWLVSFVQYDVGFFDHESGRVECMKWCARTDCFGAYGPSSSASLRTAAAPSAAASNPARRRVVEPSCFLSAVRTARFRLNGVGSRNIFCEIGAPGRIRTADHCVRSAVLYPAELRARS